MRQLPRILALVLALSSGGAAAADVGRVVLAAGDTSALRQGQVVKLALGTAVQDQDVLRTGAASNLQVRFEDDSYVSLREASELRVDQFKFTGGKGEESAVFSLLKGGLRAVTGLIGRQNHNDYKMNTPTATIGIRGTDYAATFCQGDCKNSDGTPAKDGVYGRVIGQSQGTNKIEVSNDADRKELGINSNFF
ncbi:MAG TPA: FecR family protein, partial [Vicinamibacterales bacterium]|nr:FecR family protein [Vicinamibacterales bacterium]